LEVVLKIVSFSGGKDSTALAILEADAMPVFVDTEWEFDEIYQHIERFEKVTGREVLKLKGKDLYGENLPESIKRKRFMPGFKARWCTRMHKVEVIETWLMDKVPVEMLIGLRADEPERVGHIVCLDGLTVRYPLREKGMNYQDVVDLCNQYDLLPEYPAYMARGGCKGCFYKSKNEVLAMRELTPLVYDKLQELEESVQDRRDKYAVMFPNVGMSLKEFRKQPLLFAAKDVFKDAKDTSQKAPACGAFCHR
jgi:hypothetical protein